MKPKTPITAALIALAFPSALLAATNCDSQAKPAFDCPTGYSMMCVPVGGDHWSCGKAGLDGTITEAPGVNAAPTAAPIANTAPAAEQNAAAPAPTPAVMPSPKLAPTPQAAESAPPEAPVGAVPATTPPPAAAASAPPIESDSPDTARYALYALAAAVLLALAAWIRKWLEGLKTAGLGGAKTEEKKPCARCGGKGTVTETFTETVACTHCNGSGQDPCHHCGGTGKMSSPNPIGSQEELEGLPPCDFCGGTGKKRVGAGHDWGEANEAMAGGFACCMCHGKKTESVTRTRDVPCPVCKNK